MKEQIVSSIQDKIDKLEKYKKLEFENKELEKLSSKYIDLLYTKKDLIEDGKNERVNSNGQKLEGYPSYAWLQCCLLYTSYHFPFLFQCQLALEQGHH